MGKRDPFIEGMLLVMAANPKLKPAPLAAAAEMNNTTFRKALAGTIKSMTVEKAARIARAAGLNLSTVIALGEGSHGPDVVDLALAIENASEDVRRDVDSYLRVRLTKAPGNHVELPSPPESSQARP